MKLVNKSFRQGEDGHAKLIPEEGASIPIYSQNEGYHCMGCSSGC